MNSRRRVRNVVSTFCAAALLCAAAGVSAQAIHKQVAADGHATFSDRADATPSLPAAAPPASDAENAPARTRIISTRRGAAIDANEAARRLKQARLTREQGAQPRRAEWARGSDAGTVNHRYWRRQEKLRLEVEYALRRSNETHRSLQASR